MVNDSGWIWIIRKRSSDKIKLKFKVLFSPNTQTHFIYVQNCPIFTYSKFNNQLKTRYDAEGY